MWLPLRHLMCGISYAACLFEQHGLYRWQEQVKCKTPAVLLSPSYSTHLAASLLSTPCTLCREHWPDALGVIQHSGPPAGQPTSRLVAVDAPGAWRADFARLRCKRAPVVLGFVSSACTCLAVLCRQGTVSQVASGGTCSPLLMAHHGRPKLSLLPQCTSPSTSLEKRLLHSDSSTSGHAGASATQAAGRQRAQCGMTDSFGASAPQRRPPELGLHSAPQVARKEVRACPHCGAPVAVAATSCITLKCAACATTFLNTAQDKLALGASLFVPQWPAGPVSSREQVLMHPRAQYNHAADQDGAHHRSHAASAGSAGTASLKVSQDAQPAASTGRHGRGGVEHTPQPACTVQPAPVLVEARDIHTAAAAQSGVSAACVSADPAWYRHLQAQLQGIVYGQDAAVRFDSHLA
jgi:hypothetical protein